LRKRSIKKNLYLNDYENKLLKKKAFELGLSESELLRGLIINYVPKGLNNDAIYKLTDEIRRVGININQIAHISNINGDIDYKRLYEYQDRLNDLIYEIRKEYLGGDTIGDNCFMENRN